LVGVVSERDLLANRATNPPVAEVMTAPAQVAGPDDDVAEAARRMVGARLGCLPVVERGKLVGMITVTDLVALHGAPGATQDLQMIPVGALMTREPMTVSPDDFLLDAIVRIGKRQVRHAPVVDAEGRVVGMLSDRDIRLALGASLLSASDAAAGPRLRLLKVREAMSHEPLSVQESASLASAAAAFVHRSIGALPVVDAHGRIAGILSYVDVLRALLAFAGSSAAACQEEDAPTVH
ncbi:MAG TPA: CBS domain-containing protein, partial [Myxococcales bacterium]|nr:CBS domain-containing protein [Myxococcales bacterium]